jgi:hypothetical protein
MATDVSPSWSNAIAHPAGHRRRRGAGWLLSQGKLRQLRTCTDTVYPALRSDRFDPLEKACDSTMLASLSRTARAASQQFYAGFLSRPTHCPACLNGMGAGGPQGDATLAPPGAPRALNLGRAPPRSGGPGSHQDGRLTASVGRTGSPAVGAFAAVAGSHLCRPVTPTRASSSSPSSCSRFARSAPSCSLFPCQLLPVSHRRLPDLRR